VEKYGTATQAAGDKIWRMRFASWITNATDTHSENTTLFASARLQWLCASVSMLHCLSCSCQFQEHVSQRDQLCRNHVLRRAGSCL